MTREGRLVGIISRANLPLGFSAGFASSAPSVSVDDRSRRDAILRELETRLNMVRVNVTVSEGAVRL